MPQSSAAPELPPKDSPSTMNSSPSHRGRDRNHTNNRSRSRSSSHSVASLTHQLSTLSTTTQQTSQNLSSLSTTTAVQLSILEKAVLSMQSVLRRYEGEIGSLIAEVKLLKIERLEREREVIRQEKIMNEREKRERKEGKERFLKEKEERGRRGVEPEIRETVFVETDEGWEKEAEEA